MQEFLFLILQLSFNDFWVCYVPLYCFEIEQLAPHNHFWGTKQTDPTKQRKDGLYFGTVLKQRQRAAN